MAESGGEFTHLMERARAGCEDAAQTLMARYGRDVLRAVRRRLHKRLRSKYDSADLAQEVWASFFRGPLGRFHFPSSTDLKRFLARMAGNKTTDLFRAHRCTTRRREHALDSRTVRHEVRDLAQKQASPSQALRDEEHWQQVCGRHCERVQRILLLLRQGKTYQEIARDLGMADRSVRRWVLRVARAARS
jgi:RNA polymerase sigma factor (sigma-70 family)